MSLTSWLGRTFARSSPSVLEESSSSGRREKGEDEEEADRGGTKSFLKDGHELFTASDKRGAQRDTGRRIETDGNRRLFYHSNRDTDAAEIHPPEEV